MVKKAIIPVAGLASRFLPASKVIPKTMFPIIDKPIIQLLIEEAIQSGVEQIAIIIGPNQKIIEEHFTNKLEIIKTLNKRGKKKEAKLIEEIGANVKISFFTQTEPLGDGHAILSAKDFLNKDEACLVLFGDELIDMNDINSAEKLIKDYNKFKTPIIGVQEVDKKDISKYGIVETNKKQVVLSLIEKPQPKETNSNLAIIGKYIINKEILNNISNSISGTKDGELRLIDGLKKYNKKHKIHTSVLDGERFDTGNKLGLIKANLYFGLKDKDIQQELREYIAQI